ncbi:MAG: hypothetical protein II819_01085, partial [Fibrobacter sp.]|nr:hypothetical protein [Fibrobacter sp.]
MKKAFALALSLLAAFAFAAFDESHFNYGRQWKGELKGVNLSGKGLSHLAIWLGDNATYNTYWEGDMVRACSQYDLTPVIYAYVIAEYDKDQGFSDCDMGSPNHCTNGAQTIRDHWSDILARYKSYAQGIAQDYGTSKTTIWLIEPDFFQYSASGDARSPYTQQGGGIPDAELCGTRFNQIVAAIKQYLPNAKIAVDISPWLNGDIVGWYANFDQSKVDYLFSSGGRTQGDQSRIRSDNNNLLTWAQASAAMGGKKIIADDGYGVGGGSNNDYQDWMNVNNLNNRISDGVIGITIQDPGDAFYEFAAQHPISLGGGGGNSSSSTAQSSSSRPSSSSANISPTTDKTLLVDNFEDGDYVSLWGGEWGTYNDSENGGASTIQMSVSSGNNSAKAIKVDYSLNSAGAFDYNPFVGLVVDFNEDGSTENLNACTSIQYDYKGPAHRFRVQSDLNVGDNYHGLAVSASSNSWKTQTVNWNSLTQETGWGTVQSVADVRTRANAFSWLIQLASGSTGSLLIDNVKCLGLPEAVSSSSSAKSSSSVSSSSVTSSSSVSSSSVSSSSVSSSSISSSSSVSSSGSMGGPCIAFVNGSGDYGDHCYNSGLDDMEPGKCYTMNPERNPAPQWINKSVSETYWWIETSCGIEESSSSSEESSSSAIPSYTITFKNGNVTLQTVEVEQGTIPVYTGAEPTKAATDQYTYTFQGWNPALAAATGNATYQAVFNEVTNYYSIRFLNDGAVLATQSVAYGTIPVYSGATPTKDADAAYTYAFDGWNPEIVAVTQDKDYTAKFKGTKKKYTVTFVDDDLTTVLKDAEEYDFGTLAADIVQPANPSKAANAEYTYEFAGWSPELVDVVDNVTYIATYTATKRKYPVTFVDEDGTILQATAQYDYGTRPANIVTPTDPTKPATAEFTYTFEGWTPAIAMVTGNATYTASYTSAKNKYTVTFVNGDGTSSSSQVEYGEVPVAPAGKTPANDAQYIYRFAGWTPEIVPVAGNATYTAVVNHTVNKYTVSFVDEDGMVLLAAAEYDYGTEPADIAKPANPTKQGTAGETFAFAGWTPALAAVTEDVVYTATYTSSTNSYTVTFVKDDGSVILTATYPYGTAATGIAQPRIPEKPATAEYTYEFSGWSPKIADVTGNATYTATYKEFKRKYTITYLNEDGSVFTKAEYEYGTPAKSLQLAENPTKKGTAQYTYTFTGWTPTLTQVTGETTYTATFKATVNQYTVTFLNYDNSKLQSSKVAYGEMPEYMGETPVKPSTATYNYFFDYWTPGIESVTEDVSYMAVFREEAVVIPSSSSVEESSSSEEESSSSETVEESSSSEEESS